MIQRILRRTRNAAADAALVAALPDLEPHHRRQATATLAVRQHEPALAQVVGGFNRYDADLQAILVEHADAFAPGARHCMSSAHLEERFAAVAFIRAAGQGKLAYLLADALAQPCRKTAEMAGLALGDLVEDVAARCQPTGSCGVRRRPDELEFVQQAVAKALANWPLHFRGEVAAAASMLAAPLEPVLLGLVEETRTRTARALNGMLEAAREPRHVPLALRMLRAAQVREAAGRYLAAGRDAAFCTALLDESWILADEAVRKAFVRVRNLPGLESQEGDSPTRPGRDYAAARTLAAAGLGPGRKAEMLLRRALGGSPPAARVAAWALFDQVGEQAEDALRTIAGRSSHPLAVLAKIELDRRRLSDAGTAHERANLSIAPAGPAGASPAAAPREESAFDVFWEQYETLSPDQRITIGMEVATFEDEFGRGVRARLAEADPVARRRALGIVRELGLAGEFAEQLLAAGTDPDRLVRSAAVALLGGIDSPPSRRLLRAALDDPDERVQANAIDALERLEIANVQEQLAAKLVSPSSRVRANAVKLLLRMRIRDGATHLLAMLGSNRTSDRLSALWVVERMKLNGVMHKLEALAQADPDPRIRRRARRVWEALGSGVEPAASRRGREGEA